MSTAGTPMQPGICYWNKQTARSFDGDQMVHPVPDLVVGILSKSTAKYDRGIKFEDYAAHGGREYWIIDPVRQLVGQCQLDEPIMAIAPVAVLYVTDTRSSLTRPGFQIPVRAIFGQENNLSTLLRLMRYCIRCLNVS